MVQQKPQIGDTVKAYGKIFGSGLIIGEPIMHHSMRSTTVYLVLIKGKAMSYSYEQLFPFALHVLTEKTLPDFKKGTIRNY